MLPSASGRIKLNRTLPRKLDEAPLKKRRRSPASVIIPTVLDAKSSDNLNGLYAPLGTRDGACDRIKNAGGSGLKNVLDSSCDHSEDQGASACVELKGTGGSESKSVLCSSCDHSKDQGASACSVQWEPLDSGKSNNGASCGLLRKNDASVESKPDSHPAEAAAAKDVSTQAEEYCKGTPLPINTDTDLQDQPHGGDLCHARVEVSELVQEAVSCRRAMTRSGQVSLNGVPWEKRTGIKKGTFSPSSLEPVKEDSEGESPPKEIQQNLKSESDVVHNGQNDEVLPVIEDKPLVNSAGGTDSVNVSEVTRKKKRRRTRLTVVSRQRKKVPSPAAAHLDQEERLHDFSVFLDRQKCNAMFVESSPSGKESSVKGGKRQIVGVSTSEVQGRVSRKRGQQMRSEIRKLLGQDQKRHTQSSPCMLHTRNESFAAEKRTFTMTLRTSRIGNAASSVTKPKHQAKIPSSGELHDKRLIKSPCCRTCSVPKYVTPRINTPGRGPSLKIKAESKGLKIKQKSVVTPQEEIKKSSQSKAFGIEKYPILKLCDIVKGSNIPIDVTSYKCVLPVELKTKNIKCFKIEGRDLICLKTEAQSTPCSVYSNALKKNSLVPRTRTQEIPEMVNGVLSESRFKTYDIPTQSDTGVAVCEKQNVKKTNLSCGRTIKPIGPLGINDEKDLEKSSGTLETATPAPVLTAFKIETLSLLREIQVKDALSNLAENLQSCVTDDGVKSKGDLEMSILGNLHAAQNTASTENCTVDTKPADTGGAFNRQQSYSCQRTTPYVIHTSISCARAYLPWPFVKCESSEVDCHLTCTQVLPSEDSELSGKKTENLNLSVSSPILNGSSETENSLHPSIECKEEVFTEDSSSSNASDSDMQPQTTEESVVQDSGSLLVTPVKQEGVPTICSLAIVNSPDKVKKERILQGCGLGEKAHLSACEDGKSFSETQPHRMSLKRCSSAELEEGDTNTCPVKRSLTIEPETSELCTVETKSFNPVSPCHPEKLPSASQQVKIPRTSLTFTEYLSSCQDASSADVSSSSSEDDDGLAAFAADFTAEIMCEIEDGCSSSNQRVLHHASSTSDGEASGDVMDVVKAYEQDAIVLDVIQDDPDLFGNLGEVTESVGKPSCTTKRLKKCGHSPVKTSRTVSNCKISLDGSVRCDARLGDLRNCIQRCTTPHTKDECDGMTTCNDNSMSVNTDNPVDASFHVDGGSLNRKGLAEHTSGEENKCLLRTREGSRLGEAGASFGQGFQATLPTESTFSTGSANPYIESRDNDCKTGSKQTEDSSQQGKPWSITRRLGLCSKPVERIEHQQMYCRFYFSPLLVCTRPACRFLHVPISGDEKYCMEVVQQFMKILNPSYLQRAAAVFTNYYQSSRPGIYFKCQILHSLLSTLLKRGHLRDLFAVLRITAMYKTLPPPDVLLKAFKKVTALGLKEAVLSLLDVTSKCVEAGLEFTVENFDYMQHQLNRLQVSKQELELFLAMKSRTVRREAWKTGQFDLDTAVAEIEHYKEQEDWAKIGAMFNSMCLSNGSLDSLNRFCACIASVLLKDIHSTPSVPFCKFIETVSQENHINGLDKSLLGRIGISVMFGYYKTQQWAKGRKLLDALTGMKINFSTLKGLFGNECHASRCQIVNTATEIFLKSGSVEKAMNILKDTEWMISSPMWPCESIDVVNRHNLLCKIAEQTSQKNMYVETLEVLTKLPGLHDVHCSFDVTRYDDIFNRHLWSCFKYQNLRVCCSIVEFMVSKNISVDFCLLRKLIHKLGQQCLWPKARSLYKCALSLGCYPPFQGNMYCRLLSVPCSLSEIEMTLALEVFIFSNAHDIKNPSTSALQIVLKRNEDRALISETDYHAAVNRLLSAAQITSPKLVIKYATVNVSKEQVFTLDHLSALKWLDKNMYCS